MIANHKKLRVVIGGLSLGGTERHLMYVLPKLKSMGWDIHITTLSNRCYMQPYFEQHHIPVVAPHYNDRRFQFCRSLQRFYKLCFSARSLYRDFRRDPNAITHFFLPEAYIVGSLISFVARFKGKRVMSRRSLNHYQNKYPCTKRLERLLHHKNDVILANSEKVLEQLVQEEGVERDKVRLIYNGICSDSLDESRDKLAVRKELDIPDNGLVLTIVANLIPYKGHRDLLEALTLIKGRLPSNWLLLVIGRDDGIASELKTLAQERGISAHIRWLGQQHNVPSWLKASDINLLCSHEEGFSNAILEAMMMKLPLIVTNVGGNAEAVKDQETGLVVPPKNPIALSEAILTLASDKQKCQQFGNAGYRRVTQFFSLAQCAEHYDRLYQSLLAPANDAKAK